MTLQSLQTPAGGYAIIAIDQRSSLAKILGVDVGTDSGRAIIVEVKSLFMRELSREASAVLTDGEFGLATLKEKDPRVGLLLALEESAYSLEDNEALPQVRVGWSPERIAQQGAAVKLVLHYHPDASSSTEKRAFIQRTASTCHSLQVPFLVEPLLYPVAEQSASEFAASFATEQLRVVRDLAPLCDVLKLEFPVAADVDLDIEAARHACLEITKASSVPWVLLSKGMPFERFLMALGVALESGCKGFAAGRAVWKEVGEYLTPDDRVKFVREVAVPRLRTLRQLVDHT